MKAKYKYWHILFETYYVNFFCDIGEYLATRLIKNDATTWRGLRRSSKATYRQTKLILDRIKAEQDEIRN